VISSFVDGLHPDLKKMLMLHEFKTFSECISMAQRAESAIRPIGSNKKGTNSVDLPTSYAQKEVKKKAHFKSKNFNSQDSQGSGSVRSNQGPNRPENVTCFHCEEQGHFRPECPYGYESVMEARVHKASKN